MDRRQGNRGGRWVSRFSGIGFAVALLAALILAFPPDARGANGASQLAQYYADRGNQAHLELAVVLSALAGFFFLWFLGRLVSALSTGADHDSFLVLVAFAGGLFFAILLVSGLALSTVVGITLTESSSFKLDPSTGILINTLGYEMAALSMFGAAALLIATATAGRRGRVLPRWLELSSYVLGGLSLLSGVFVYPFLLLFVAWVVVVGLRLAPVIGVVESASAATVPA
jgi:hypothetical protein